MLGLLLESAITTTITRKNQKIYYKKSPQNYSNRWSLGRPLSIKKSFLYRNKYIANAILRRKIKCDAEKLNVPAKNKKKTRSILRVFRHAKSVINVRKYGKSLEVMWYHITSKLTL